MGSQERVGRAFDVVVVGGGPAGAAAATSLCRTGHRVALFDRARFPREKCCGDGLTTNALRRLEHLGLRPGAVPSWQIVDDVVVRGPSGHAVRFPLPRTTAQFAAVARRAELDAALLDVARRAGVEVHEGHRVADVVVGEAAVEVDVEAFGTVDAAFVVAADGMWSPVRKMVCAPDDQPYLGDWHALRQYFTSVTGPAATDLVIWFEPELLPGYAWSFPLPGQRANVGFGIQRGAKVPTKAMGGLWAELLARPHIAEALGPDARPEGPHRAWPIPALIHEPALTAGGGRVLFVGDAARAADPMSGEGIGQALETGMLAAEAIGAARSRPAEVARRYEREVGRGLVLDSRLSAQMNRGLKHRKGARIGIRTFGTTPIVRKAFARWLFEDVPRAVLLTPSRWSPRMLRAQGAFPGTRQQVGA